MEKCISLVVTVLLVSLVTVFSVTAGGQGETATGGPVTINFWAEYTGFEALGMNQALDRFNATHPNIRVVYTGQSDVDKKVIAAVLAGDPPEVAEIGNNQNFPQLVQGGTYTALNDLFKTKSLDFSLFWEPWTERAVSFGGKIWGMPLTDWVLALVYNKDMFKAAGLDPENPPRTIADFNAAQRALTKKDAQGNITQTGLSFRTTFPGAFAPYFSYIFGSTPETLYDAQNKKFLKPEALYQAWEWLQSFPKEYGAQALQKFVSGFGDWGTSAEPFLSGKMAMSLNGPWIAQHIQQYAPNMNWGVAPVFAVKSVADKGPFGMIGMDVMTIPKGAKNTSQAMDFMIWFSGKEGQYYFDTGKNGTGRIPTVKDYGGADFFKAADPVNPKLNKWVELIGSKNLGPIPYGSPAEQAYNTELNAILDPVLNLQIDARAAVDQAITRAQASLDRM
jgi:multiple sugar transport system substrate-binding protein